MYGVNQTSNSRRGCFILAGVFLLFLVLAGIFAAFYLFVLKGDDESPSPISTAATTSIVLGSETPASETKSTPPSTATLERASASDTSQPPASPTATRATPTTVPPTPTPLPPPEVITIGVRAQITASVQYPVNLRNRPNLTGSVVITQMVNRTPLDVYGGPEDAGDLRWWNVQASDGITGWVVEAFQGTTCLLPVDWTSQAPPLAVAPPTPEPTQEAEATPTLAPTGVVTATPTLEPTGVMTITPTLEPTEAVTITPTLEPTEAVTVTPTLEPTEAVTTTPTLEPTATPTPGPGTPTAVPSPQVGGRVRINVPEYGYLNLRQNPGLDAETIGKLDDGVIVSVIEGPEEQDGIVWWKVKDDEGLEGWAAERLQSQVWMIPVE